jgi:hypothetical protein
MATGQSYHQGLIVGFALGLADERALSRVAGMEISTSAKETLDHLRWLQGYVEAIKSEGRLPPHVTARVAFSLRSRIDCLEARLKEALPCPVCGEPLAFGPDPGGEIRYCMSGCAKRDPDSPMVQVRAVSVTEAMTHARAH